MGLNFYKQLLFQYRNAALPLKISIPFIMMFLGFWVTSTAVVGIFVSNKLEQNQQEQSRELAALVEREIDQELNALRRVARLLSIEIPIVQGALAQDQNRLRQAILPLVGILDTNVINIINNNQQSLFTVQNAVLNNVELQGPEIYNLVLTGSDIATIVGTSDSGPPVLIGTAPIKSGQGIVGGILLGTALDNDLLTQINRAIKEQIIVLSEGVIIASTFPAETSPLETLELSGPNKLIAIGDEEFLAQPVYLKGLGDQQFELVLLISQRSLLRTQRAIWVFVALVASLGSVITTTLGYWIARIVVKPIQDITLVAQRVAGESRFDLRATTNTQDEINILALSLNQLIEWVGQYTYDLEEATLNLETRVEERTQELSDALKKLKDTQAQLIQTEKMSSLGQMIAGIAHEINNPIGFIQGNIEPLNEYFQDLLELIETYQTEYPQPTSIVSQKQREIDLDFLIKDLNKLLGSMNVGTERVHEIVKSLRNFSRLDEATVKDVNIHDGLNSTLLILNHRIKHQVTVVKDYGDLPLVRCFPAQLNQVFTNIIANALDAMLDSKPDGANVSERKHLTIVTRAISKKQIQIVICDSGPGIPPEVRTKIFDPFFTTKPVGKGTGLGLGICFKIIQQHQGNIEVSSKMGQGTEFIITLPTDVLPADPVIDFAAFVSEG
ncbi:HAMP domain-containing protein [Leptolyngbya cf. ectocarpi LEGE 11479]|uniref:histidine kinase n=1 Tax=Leptolyngbya cf. ectocarpi LEGE 11479 TaxID=1828722 RepID=A0A928X231_LEPEC|nr:ATP-binding protein [Leptolyngbya ectocarpi]MBE9067022.1 HAMP domain-containing protein [Leptolyngbya cf. ectocarpi LEGE 11479]